jgi:hypothetical protein
MQKPKSPNERPPADKLYSTYWWIIVLDSRHPDNNPNGITMHGYSKFQGHDEMFDKEMLLLKKILMLAQHGYVKKCQEIEIFWRAGNFVDKKNDEKMLTLYPRSFILEKRFMQPKFLKLQTFLTKLYDAIAHGKQIDNLLPKRKINFTKDDYIDVNKWFFKSKAQLSTHCTRLIQNKHPFDAVINFREKYLEKYPDLP